MEDSQVVLEQFRRFAGDKRFRKFVEAVHCPPLNKFRKQCPGLLFWQEDLWQEFSRHTTLSIPMDYHAIVDLFEHVPRPPEAPTLAESEVPAWCHIKALEGQCPVQGTGSCFGREWYFRARGKTWELDLARESGVSIEECWDSGAFVGIEELYEAYGQYSAGYMPANEARFFIVVGLRRLLLDIGISV